MRRKPDYLPAAGYFVAVLAFPSLIESMPVPCVYAVWLGGLFVAGLLLRDRWVFGIPMAAVGIQLVGGVMLGAFPGEFYDDALTAMALLYLLFGELCALALGWQFNVRRGVSPG